jgi:hypothetical protein
MKLDKIFNRSAIWTGFLFLISAAYLIFELAFNSRIVDGATGGFNALQMEALELQGRILSGIGMSLLLLKFLDLSNLKSFIIKAIIISSLAFSLMFFGQKILIEYLVDNSTKDERINAQHIALLKSGVLNQHVVLEDISIEKEFADTPATKAMMSVMGVMIFNSNTFITRLKENADGIVETAARNDAEVTFPEAYNTYRDYQSNVNDMWVTYSDGVNEYEKQANEIRIKSIEKTNSVYEEAGREFIKETSIARDEEAIIRTTLEIKRAVSDYYDSKVLADERCSEYKTISKKCHIKIENTYRDIVIEKAGKYVPPDYWCHPEKEERLTKTVRGRQHSVVEKTQDCTSMDRNWFEKKLSALSGVESDIGENRDVAKAVRERLASEGVVMDMSWRMADRQSMTDAFSEKGQLQLDAAYRERIIKEVGEYIPPTLEQSAFINLPMIQNPIKRKLEWTVAAPVSLKMTPDVFFETVHLPRYLEPMMDMKLQLLSEGETYADGQINETKGKDYYRSIIVPPFAMSFSLFFGLLNLFSFTGTVFTWVINRKWLAKIASTSVVGAVFIGYPLLFSSPAVQSKAFEYFSDQLEKETHPILPHFAAWVIDTQPIMYPIGHNLSKVVGQSKVEEYLLGLHHAAPSVRSASSMSPSQESEPVEVAPVKNAAPVEIAPAVEPIQIENEDSTRDIADWGVYQRLSVSTAKEPPHSLSLLAKSAQAGKGIMIDVMPIGELMNEDWVVYDSKVVNGEICLLGRRVVGALASIKASSWAVSRYGNCSNENAETLASLNTVLRAAVRTNDVKPIIVQLNDSVTGEVYCKRYDALRQRISSTVKGRKVIWTTSSRSVLGCLANVDESEHVAYTISNYSEKADSLKSKKHDAISRDEWSRLKTVESGQSETFSELSPSFLETLLFEAPFLKGVIVHERLLNKHNNTLIEDAGKWVMSMNDAGEIVSVDN